MKQINTIHVTRYMGYLGSLLHPQEEKVGYYFQSGTCLGALEPHVLLSFLWPIFCKCPVITVTPQTLKKQYIKYKANNIFYNSINEFI